MTSPVSISLSAAILVVGDPAFAKRRLRLPRLKGGGGGKIYTPDTLTVAELKECLIAQKNLNELDGRITSDEEFLSTYKRELERQQRELERQQIALNRYSEADVRKFNASVSNYERIRSDFNKYVSEHNLQLQKVRDLTQAFNDFCGGKTYYADDMMKAEELIRLSN
ncbi:MAG: hypothetical protein JJ858_19180 [Rhizobiaceae bacterium]|nr:hypothetical protein [Rhizobiaceae bacterium]